MALSGKMNEAKIYERLESIRDKYLDDSTSIPKEINIKLDRKNYTQRAWAESHKKGELIVFILEAESFLVSKAYCLGLIINKAGSVEKLSNEQLWEIGIP